MLLNFHFSPLLPPSPQYNPTHIASRLVGLLDFPARYPELSLSSRMDLLFLPTSIPLLDLNREIRLFNRWAPCLDRVISLLHNDAVLLLIPNASDNSPSDFPPSRIFLNLLRVSLQYVIYETVAWQAWQGSNLQSSDLESDALPIEPQTYTNWVSYKKARVDFSFLLFP